MYRYCIIKGISELDRRLAVKKSDSNPLRTQNLECTVHRLLYSSHSSSTVIPEVKEGWAARIDGLSDWLDPSREPYPFEEVVGKDARDSKDP